jgi:hypothetical protein
MSYLALVAVCDGRKHLSHDLSCLVLCESFLLKDGLEQLAARAELLDDVEIFIIFKELVEFNNVGVINDLHDRDLILDHLKLGLRLVPRLLNYFQSSDHI